MFHERFFAESKIIQYLNRKGFCESRSSCAIDGAVSLAAARRMNAATHFADPKH